MTDEIHHRYPPSITTPATARRDVADYLRGRAAPELVETVVLLVDELVTNSLAHAGGDVELRARLTDGTLQVEVYDGSDTLPRQQERDIRGHGLDIVDALASAWGVRTVDGSGKVTWFDLQLT